jgi:hypothetical protein
MQPATETPGEEAGRGEKVANEHIDACFGSPRIFVNRVRSTCRLG